MNNDQWAWFADSTNLSSQLNSFHCWNRLWVKVHELSYSLVKTHCYNIICYCFSASHLVLKNLFLFFDSLFESVIFALICAHRKNIRMGLYWPSLLSVKKKCTITVAKDVLLFCHILWEYPFAKTCTNTFSISFLWLDYKLSLRIVPKIEYSGVTAASDIKNNI